MDLRDALPQVGRRGERQGAPPVRAEEEPDLGTAQGQRFDHRRYRVRLGPHRAEEAAAHGKIQEQVAHLHRRARRMGSRRRLDYLSGEDPHAGAEVIYCAAFAGREREIRDRADGVQGLAAKAQRDDAGEVVRGPDLARRVLRDRASRVLGRHPRAVVADPDQGHPTPISTSTSPRPRVREFSINSLTADAGRSMTSPAAILCATSGDSTRTRPA